MRHPAWLPLMLLALTGAVPSGAQTVDPASELGQFRSLRADGMTALDAGDQAKALESFTQAQAILPDSPSIALLRAQVLLQQKQTGEARAQLMDYLKRGNVLDLGRYSEFNAIWDSALEDQQHLNQVDKGSLQTVASVPDFMIAEAISYAPDTQQVYLSGIRNGKVLALTPDGQSQDVITFRPGVAAYGLGMHDGTLWAATAQSRQTTGYDLTKPVTSKIVAINPADGSITTSISDAGADRRFGHMLAGRDNLYVIDSNAGAVLRLAGYGPTLDMVLPEGYMDSPQGLAESEDGSVLMVSDFVSGLYRIDLKAQTMARLLPPSNANLLGLSSLTRYGHDLIAIQNGFKPNRVLRLHMSDDWLSIESVEELVRSDKLLSQPSQGMVSDNAFVFIAKSQWGHLDDQGNAKTGDPDPVVLGVIKLTP
ncbi:MAG: tetratricopeptide repeat protein [Asticcacaulis sp.]